MAVGCDEKATDISHTVVCVPPTGNCANVPKVSPVVVVVIDPEFVIIPQVPIVAARVVKVNVCLPVFCAV